MTRTPPLTRAQLDRRIDAARQLRSETLRAMGAPGWAAARRALGAALSLVRQATTGALIVRRP